MYKVWVLNDNKVENIFIFRGKNKDKEDPFSEADKRRIKIDNVPATSIISSPVQIHKDDSILQIKKKILNEFGKESLITYHELYLFAYNRTELDLYRIFTETVSRSSNYLNRTKFAQLLNILGSPVDPESVKEKNTYDDFVKAMARREKIANVPISLGMLPSHDHLFSPNPYDIVDFSPRTTASSENSLLMNYGEITDNNIYVCLTDDVFACHKDADDFIAKTYYPFLTEKSIFDSASLSDKREQLIAETTKIMHEKYFKSYEIVDLFYDTLKIGKSVHIPVLERGTRNYRIAIKPHYQFIMPLEFLFKNIHASAKYKLMKLNPGMRRENIYRLYSDKISKTGRKMPALPKSVINSLAKNIGKHKQISISNKQGPDDKQDVTIDIEIDGTIILHGSMEKSVDAAALAAHLKASANPMLEDINGHLKNSGYAIPLITDLTAKTIEILDMDYTFSIGNIKIEETKTKAKKTNIDLEKIQGCLYAIFDVINKDVFKGATLRFKRVENYKDMDQQTLLMTETYKKTGRDSDVIDVLMKNHAMTMEEAKDRIRLYKKDVEYMQVNKFNDGANTEEKTIKVVENPGLPIEMNLDPVTKILTFRTNEITNIGYIETLSGYFESMMRIWEDKKLIKKCSSEVGEKAEIIKIVEEKPVELRKRVDAFDFSPSVEIASIAQEEEETEKSPIETIAQIIKESKEDSDSSEFDMVGLDVESLDDDDMVGIEQIEDEEGEGSNGGSKNNMRSGGPKKKEESDEEDEDEEEEEGDEYIAKNKDKAKNTNPFLQKLHEKEPNIFLNGKDGKYSVYSRTCQSVHRQPVLITEEEKEYIDKISPGSYSKAMKFGSTPENQNYYICPRFWCFKNNVSMTADQIKNKECGTDPEYWQEFNIPKEHLDAKGNYITHHPGFKHKYKSKKTDYCMPCCGVSKWEMHEKDETTGKWKKANYKLKEGEKINELGQLVLKNGKIDERRKEFPKNADKCDITDADEMIVKKKPMKNVKFIYEPRVLPEIPEEGRWGYVQKSVEHFMQIDYKEIQAPGEEHRLQPGAFALLKYGVEQNKIKNEKKEDVPFNSVLGCLADILPNPPRVSDGAFGKILAKAVNINDFVKYGNASFTATFRPHEIEEETAKKHTSVIDNEGLTWIKSNGIWTNEKTKEAGYPKTVKTMKIWMSDDDLSEYKKIKGDDNEIIMEKMAAYEMYKLYLENPAIEKEVNYIWDLVSINNDKLFNPGLNMLIMEIKNNDITDNIDVICPTITYSKTKFDIEKPTVFLIKHPNNLFEPVYLLDEASKDVTRTFLINDKDKEMPQNIKSLLKKMNKTLNENCHGKNSILGLEVTGIAKDGETKMEIVQPLSLIDLETELEPLENYEITEQIANYQGKIIAVRVRNNTNKTNLYIPCKPSVPSEDTNYDIEIMDNANLWSNYETTKNELEELGEHIDYCRPVLKIIEDKLIVGILTKSNQMVPINPPEEDFEGEPLPTLKYNSFTYNKTGKKGDTKYVDSIITKTKKGDEKREEIMFNAMAENDFYKIFRSTIKILLSDPKNHKIRDQLLLSIHSTNTQRDKLIKTVENLIELIEEKEIIEFVESDNADLFASLKKNGKVMYKCEKNYSETYNQGCKLLLPKKNLVNTSRNNILLYYYRIADELLRYNSLKNFILYPNQFLNTGMTDYKINKDEMIALESSLQNDQDERMTNEYMSGEIAADMAMPEKTEKYLNMVELIDNPAKNNHILKTDSIEGNGSEYWKKDVFKTNEITGKIEETTYHATVEASYEPLMKAYQKEKKLPDKPTIAEMREIVWESYRDLVSDRKTFMKIKKILQDKQGKSELLKNVTTAAELEIKIKEESSKYFLTTLDFYAVAQKHHLPIILFSNASINLKDLGLTEKWLIIGLSNPSKPLENKFNFIRSQKLKPGAPIPSHQMIVGRFDPSQLNAMKQPIEEAMRTPEKSDNIMSIEEFLKV